jgi:transcription initiation factor IIE alpha subunit
VEAIIERLYDGVYECPSCDVEFSVERATKDDLFCEECGGDLIEVSESDTEPDDGEPDGEADCD